jgi:DNA-binding MarR family transcriptional regulator
MHFAYVAQPERSGYKFCMIDDDTLALGSALERLHGPVAAEVFRRTAATPDGIYSLSRMLALLHLSARGPQTISQLAWAIPLSHAATSRMVDGLVQLDLVDRREDEADRRHKVVQIKIDGERQVTRFRGLAAEIYAEKVAALPATERQHLARILNIILDALPSSEGAPQHPTAG